MRNWLETGTWKLSGATETHLAWYRCVYQFSCSVASLCDPMDCSTPGFPIHHQLPELAQTHVLSSWWCHPTISSSVVPFSSHLQSFPASGSFQMSPFFAGGQSIGVWLHIDVFHLREKYLLSSWVPGYPPQQICLVKLFIHKLASVLSVQDWPHP